MPFLNIRSFLKLVLLLAALAAAAGQQLGSDPQEPFASMLRAAQERRLAHFQSLTVEGSNAVLAIEFQPRMGSNILAKIAFDKEVRPVWATTNGVSIGTIPTNCVFYSDVISNKLVTRVVY